MSSLDQIQARLTALRRGYKGWLMTAAGLGIVAIALWSVLLFVLSDLAFQLSPALCWTGWAMLWIFVLGLLGMCVWSATRRMTAEHMCSRVESCSPELGNRLINVVQFSNSADERERRFAQSLMGTQPVQLDHISAWQLFPLHWLKMTATASALALCAGILVFALNPRGMEVSVQRLLMPMRGLEPYSLTRIADVLPGNTIVPRGEKALIRVRLEGKVPRKPMLVVQPERGEAKQIMLVAVDGEPLSFTAETPLLFDSTTYWFIANDARSPRFTIGVQSPPSLVNWAADVQPPAYTSLPRRRLSSEQPEGGIPVGAEVQLTGKSSQPLRQVVVLQDGRELQAAAVADAADFRVTFPVPGTAPLQLRLVSTAGLDARIPLPLTILPDLGPTVDFATDLRQITAAPGERIALPFVARDEYGVASVLCVRVEKDGADQEIAVERNDELRREMRGHFAVDLAALGAKAGSRLRFRLLARDAGPAAEARQGASRLMDIVIPLPDEERRSVQGKRAESERSVARLIQLQKENLSGSRKLQTQLAGGSSTVDVAAMAPLLVAQVEIRRLAAELLTHDAVLGDLLITLRELETNEMQQAVAALDALTRAPDRERMAPLAEAIALQARILAVLTGLPTALANEQSYKDKTDLLGQLQRMVARQRELLADTKSGMQAELQGDGVALLVRRQEQLADEAILFIEAVKRMANAESEDSFARQLANVHVLLTSGRLYEKMLTAADELSQVNWAAGIQAEEEALRLLTEALKIMNKWRVEKARESIADASMTLRDIAEQLADMEKRQNEIVEVTKDLTRRGNLDDKVRAELAKLDEEQKQWQEKIEKMAQDLYQFPELPVSNDLNSKMREVYEDVEQAANSENAPSVEIAVQKEDGLLEAIKNTKERVEDVEMWLPDIPDNIKWDLESFDAAEFPDMPLVDLPEELEDIVGDLLDQSADIDMQSQDSTGNQMMADAEMGWGVMDGPMPNFSAKGKSGNTKPNDNEMTGRSGAGREGQSTGELVENTVKGLEGRETHARKTNDPLQKGQVEEAEDSTLDARATGGGKLGGESETIGMFGNAPRRDMHMQAPSANQALRQETEAMYATARLLYMNNTEPLGEAARDMRRVERMDKDQKEYASLQQRVMKQLQETQTELASGAVLPMSVSSSEASGGSAGDDTGLQDIDEDYRGIVSDYYKNLDN